MRVGPHPHALRLVSLRSLAAAAGAADSSPGRYIYSPARPLSNLPLYNRVAQSRHRRSEMSLGRIPEFDDVRMLLERRLHDAALNALAAAVNQPHFLQSNLVCRVDIFLDDRWNVPWRERVEVDGVFYRDVVHFSFQLFSS